jgi:hypothetical protein
MWWAMKWMAFINKCKGILKVEKRFMNFGVQNS